MRRNFLFINFTVEVCFYFFSFIFSFLRKFHVVLLVLREQYLFFVIIVVVYLERFYDLTIFGLWLIRNIYLDSLKNFVILINFRVFNMREVTMMLVLFFNLLENFFFNIKDYHLIKGIVLLWMFEYIFILIFPI